MKITKEDVGKKFRKINFYDGDYRKILMVGESKSFCVDRNGTECVVCNDENWMPYGYEENVIEFKVIKHESGRYLLEARAPHREITNSSHREICKLTNMINLISRDVFKLDDSNPEDDGTFKKLLML